MSSAAIRHDDLLGFEEFLAFLDQRPGERWELLDGVPVAMVGGTRAHARLGGNIASAIRPLASARGCDAIASFFVRTLSGSMLEPDLMVECSGGAPADRSTDQPTIVFEVLSPSTMHYDRSEKARRYRALPSLKQLVFVYQDSIRVESWLRQDEGWSMEPAVLTRSDDSLALPTLGASLPLSAIYLDVITSTNPY